MSEPKHTPGEWRIDYPHVRADHTAVRNEGRPHAIVYVCTNRRVFATGEAKANAHLIAAAPDLYEAIKAAVNGGFACPEPMLQRLEAAIAKAEGR